MQASARRQAAQAGRAGGVTWMKPAAKRLVLPLPGRLRRGGHGVAGAAVVRAVAGDDLVLAGVAGLQPVLAGQLDRRLVRLRAAGEELHRRVLRRGDLDQQLGQPQRRRIGGHGRRGEGDLPRLLGGDVDDLLQAVPEIDGEDAGETVDVGLPEDVGDADTLPALQDERVGAERLHLGEIDHHPRGVRNGLLDHQAQPSPMPRCAGLREQCTAPETLATSTAYPHPALSHCGGRGFCSTPACISPPN